MMCRYSGGRGWNNMAVKVMHSNDLKYSNKLSILKLLRDGIISRADMASRLKLSRATVSSIVEELISSGFVSEIGFGKSTEQGGKKPVMLKLNVNAVFIAAVYFSYNLVEVAITDLQGNIVARSKIEIDVSCSCESQCTIIVETIRNLIDSLRKQGFCQPLMAGGIVIKGLVDTECGELVYSATLPGWNRVPMTDFFEKELSIPFYMENDVRAVATFELERYRERKPKVMMCVNAERGVGVGLAINEKIYYGANSGVSATHMILDPHGPLCSCGNHGCWDIMTSVEVFAGKIHEAGGDRYLDLPYERIVQLYNGNDAVVRSVADEYIGYWMSIGVQNAVNCYNPDLVVLVGEYFRDFPTMRKKVENAIHEMPNAAARNAEVVFSDSEEDLFLKSAACIVFLRFFSSAYHQNMIETIENSKNGKGGCNEK